MKKRYYLALACVAVLTVYVRSQFASPVPAAHKSVAESLQNSSGGVPAPQTLGLEASEKNIPLSLEDGSLKEILSQNFAKHLAQMGSCLDVKNIVFEEIPTLQNLATSLRPEQGDLQEVAADWFNTHVQRPDGEERRIRIEVEALGEEGSRRVLKYYGLDAEGLPQSLEVPVEQKLNPSEGFVAQLEQEGRVTLREKAVHASFKGGAEIYYVERNGLLKDLEVSLSGRSFKCSTMDSIGGLCQCL